MRKPLRYFHVAYFLARTLCQSLLRNLLLRRVDFLYCRRGRGTGGGEDCHASCSSKGCNFKLSLIRHSHCFTTSCCSEVSGVSLFTALVFHVFALEYRQHCNCIIMREIVHLQAGQCGNQIGAKVSSKIGTVSYRGVWVFYGRRRLCYMTCMWAQWNS
jgi:Tubulin